MLQLSTDHSCTVQRKTPCRSNGLRPRRACGGRRRQQARSSPRDALEALFLKDAAPGCEEERSAVQQGSTAFAHPPVDWSLYYIQASLSAAQVLRKRGTAEQNKIEQDFAVPLPGLLMRPSLHSKSSA
eukprot:1158637-Pelagomonas_calceolata.AAC.1